MAKVSEKVKMSIDRMFQDYKLGFACYGQQGSSNQLCWKLKGLATLIVVDSDLSLHDVRVVNRISSHHFEKTLKIMREKLR